MQLEGITVVEICENIAGPQAGQILADMGATVIKVENPDGGDSTRRLGTPRPGGSAAMFHAYNRNKRSLAFDLKDPEQAAGLKRFIREEADVVLQNLRPGVMEKLGLGAEDLLGADPRLIYASIGAFSKKGPNRHRGGYDMLLQGFCGLLSINGEPSRPPVRIPVSAIDMTSGIWIAMGILGALLRRGTTGKGGLVETSLFEAAMALMANPVAQYSVSGVTPGRWGARLAGVVPIQPFDAADGQIIIAAANDRTFVGVAKVLGHPEWGNDPRFATAAARDENSELLLSAMADILGRQSCAYWIERLDAAGVPCGPVNDVAGAVADEETAISGILGSPPGRDDIRLVLSPLSLDGERAGMRSGPPDLGEFNEEFMARYGGDKLP